MEQRDVRAEAVLLGRIMRAPQRICPRQHIGRQLRRDQEGFVPGWAHISPRARRIANQRATLALCCSSVLAKTCPPLPSATMYSASVCAGLSTASIEARPGLVIGPLGRPT